jgi:hypothetical protein
MEKSTETINGNTRTIHTSRVFGGVDCQLKLADIIEDDLAYRLPESAFQDQKPIEVVKIEIIGL